MELNAEACRTCFSLATEDSYTVMSQKRTSSFFLNEAWNAHQYVYEIKLETCIKNARNRNVCCEYCTTLLINNHQPHNLRNEQKEMHDKGPNFMDASHPTVCYSAAFLRGRKARNALRLQISINAKVFGFCCWAKNGTLLLIGRRASFTNVLF